MTPFRLSDLPAHVQAKAITLTLPEPPSANRYWRVYRGRAVKSSDARDYSVLVFAAFRAQTTIAQRNALPLRGDVSVALRWHRGARRGDLDNRIKVCLDAVRGLLFVDDSQVVSLSAERHESPRAGRLEIEVQRSGTYDPNRESHDYRSESENQERAQAMNEGGR